MFRMENDIQIKAFVLHLRLSGFTRATFNHLKPLLVIKYIWYLLVKI
jgi:hypothetical protein